MRDFLTRLLIPGGGGGGGETRRFVHEFAKRGEGKKKREKGIDVSLRFPRRGERNAEGGKKGGIRAVLFGNRICNWVFKRRYFGFDVGEFWWEKEI